MNKNILVNQEGARTMNRFVMPHMYLFFGIILFILAEFTVPAGGFYWLTFFISITCIVIGLIWNVILLLFKKRS